MLKALAIIIVLAIAGVVSIAATQPESFEVERALRMQAPPERVFPLISDFANWSLWSPWIAKDPEIEITMSTKTSGLGARYEWAGNRDVGRGRMEMVTVLPPSSVRLKLTIFEPVHASNIVDFTLTPFGDFTKVTWAMSGPMDFKTKLMSVFTSMDDFVGPDFDLGLARMKTVAEQPLE